VPTLAAHITKQDHKLMLQPAFNPETNERKRAYDDADFIKNDAVISEDLSDAKVIFGLKEVDIPCILPNKTYLIFSHTHKGQPKNRKMLQTFVDNRTTLIDYELITDEKNRRLITAFTYYAGYAGMIDSLWALGKRLEAEGVTSRFKRVPQAIEKQDLKAIKNILHEIGGEISQLGTTIQIPPIIIAFLGAGKTSIGAQEVLDSLPVVNITPQQVPDIFIYGSRNFIYKVVLDIPDMFRLKADTDKELIAEYKKKTRRGQSDFYKSNPAHFESNMDKFVPYCMMVMNCILWSPKYVRPISKDNMQNWYRKHKNLRVIGDISCDPEGGVEFSRDTWIDNPVFTYDPETKTEINASGYASTGISVMAVTNLPCEFPKDASTQFSHNLESLLDNIIKADYDAQSIHDSGLNDVMKRAAIMWQGEFCEHYKYMEVFLPKQEVEIEAELVAETVAEVVSVGEEVAEKPKKAKRKKA
jgi:saccharopine dehydrogenase (NAD+, L-lysine forming)